MSHAVTPLAASGWEIATAVGTIVAAIATAGAVVTALIVGAQDRKAARAAHEEQLQAAELAQKAQLDAANVSQQRQFDQLAAERRREHTVDLLLAVQEQLARFIAHPHSVIATEATSRVKGLLLALPLNVASHLTAVSAACMANVNVEGMPTLQEKYPGPRREAFLQARAHEELAEVIQWVSSEW